MRRSLPRLGSYIPTVRKSINLTPQTIPIENFIKLSNRDLATYISKIAKLEDIRSIGISSLVSSIESRKEFFTHKEIFKIFVGFSNMNVLVTPALLSVLNDGIQIHRSEFAAHEISIILVELSACIHGNVFTGLETVAAKIFSSLLAEFESKIFAANPYDLANVMASISNTTVLFPASLMEKIALSATIQMGMFRGPELADLLTSFALLNVHSEILLNAALPHMSDRMHRLWLPQLADLMFVIAHFGYPESMAHSVCEKFESTIVSQLEDRVTEWAGIAESIKIKKIPDLLISIHRLGALGERIPKTMEMIQIFVRNHPHDWYLLIHKDRFPDLVSAIAPSLRFGRDIYFPPIQDEYMVPELIQLLARMYSESLIREVDIQYGKNVLNRLGSVEGIDFPSRVLGLDRGTILESPPCDLPHQLESVEVDQDTKILYGSYMSEEGIRKIAVVPDEGFFTYESEDRELKKSISEKIPKDVIVIDAHTWRSYSC